MYSTTKKHSLPDCNKLEPRSSSITAMTPPAAQQHDKKFVVPKGMGVLSSTPSCCNSGCAATGAEERGGGDQYSCSSFHNKKRRTLKCNFRNSCSPLGGAGSSSVVEEETSAGGEESSSSRAFHPLPKIHCATKRAFDGQIPPGSFHYGHQAYPLDKQIRRRFNRRHSKVGKMFYENDARTLLYLTSVTPNFDSDQNSQGTQIDWYEQIINKMESSMNVG